MNNFFSLAEIREGHKQVESDETGNRSEQTENVLKTLTVDYQGRFAKCEAFRSLISRFHFNIDG